MWGAAGVPQHARRSRLCTLKCNTPCVDKGATAQKGAQPLTPRWARGRAEWPLAWLLAGVGVGLSCGTGRSLGAGHSRAEEPWLLSAS